jgi:4-hydroxy-4-methyl-2-oxoglutarate aldolase
MDHAVIVSRLLKLDSCAVSDALDKLGLPAAVSGISPRTKRGRLAGQVITVKLGRADPQVPSTRHLCTAAIETAAPGNVIIVEQLTGLEAAGWGGVLSNAAKIRGLSGVIVEGPARDIDESEELAFPVYSRSITPRTARGRIQEVAMGGPVRVGDVSVASGDYVLADSTGIVFLQSGAAEKILKVAEHVTAREAAMTRDLKGGRSVGAVMGSVYEDMLKAQ